MRYGLIALLALTTCAVSDAAPSKTARDCTEESLTLLGVDGKRLFLVSCPVAMTSKDADDEIKRRGFEPGDFADLQTLDADLSQMPTTDTLALATWEENGEVLCIKYFGEYNAPIKWCRGSPWPPGTQFLARRG